MGLGDKIFGKDRRVYSSDRSNVPRRVQAKPRPVHPAPKQMPVRRKKPAPPDQTYAENFYYVKQMQARTPVAVVLNNGEVLRGMVEWYDRECIKLTRIRSPNLLLYKHSIKYVYKDGDNAVPGGANGQWCSAPVPELDPRGENCPFSVCERSTKQLNAEHCRR